MDNKINDMATPGCSHWLPLPVPEAQPALPSIQNLSDVRNIDQNIGHLPSPVPAPAGVQEQTGGISDQVRQGLRAGLLSTPHVFSQPTSTLSPRLTDPTPFLSKDLYLLCRRDLVKEDYRVEALRLAAPRIADESDREYAARLVMLSGDIGLISALSRLSPRNILPLRRAALENNEGRAKMLCRVYPQFERESRSLYARRLVMLSDDIEAIVMVSGRTRKHVAELGRLAKAINYERMEKLRQAYPRRENEGDGEYARRLLTVSKDLKSIALLSGATMMTVYQLRRTVIAEEDGRAANIRDTFPQLPYESAHEYVCRLIPLSEDVEGISAASGMSLGHVQLLKRRATENM